MSQHSGQKELYFLASNFRIFLSNGFAMLHISFYKQLALSRPMTFSYRNQSILTGFYMRRTLAVKRVRSGDSTESCLRL